MLAFRRPTSATLDILLLGATGHIGRLIARYLATHPHRTAFSFGLASHSSSELKSLMRECAALADVPIVEEDITNVDDVDRVVRRARVIINAVGPDWRWGTSIVNACVRHGTHYVDPVADVPWVRDIIMRFDYAASHSGSVIIPCAGLNSVPSDILAYLGNKTLKAFAGPSSTVDKSTSAWKIRGMKVSGGMISSILAQFKQVPKRRFDPAKRDFALSPIEGVNSPQPRPLYTLPIFKTPVQGAWHPMAVANLQIVQRSWGLFELGTQNPGLMVGPSQQSDGEREDTAVLSYGSQFKYEDFLVHPGFLGSLLAMLVAAIVSVVMWLFPPVRLLTCRFVTQQDSTTDERLEGGALDIANVTTSLPDAQGRRTTVCTIFRGKGQPRYLLSSVMTAECALCLALEANRLPGFARRGGVLTPMTAFGDVLIERLKATGRITIQSDVMNHKKLGSKQ